MGVIPQDRDIHRLFSKVDSETEKKIQFCVPKYQRSYIWQKEEWEKLFDDIKDNSGHFLGTLVVVPLDQEGEEPFKRFEVIDGQQRMTATSLFLLAIFDRIEELYSNFQHDESTQKDDLQTYFSQRSKIMESLWVDSNSKEYIKLELSKIKSNNSDYEYLIRSKMLPNNELPAPKYFNMRQISRCFDYFNKTIKDLNMKELLALSEKVFSAIVVMISAGSESNAYLIFETLNNRGQPLSVVDIVKNKLFAKLDQGNIVLDEIEDDWRQHVENIGSNSDKENFFRHFYLANKFNYDDTIFRRGNRPKKASKSNIVDIYEDLIKHDAAELWNKLKTQAATYSSLIEPKLPDGTSGDRIKIQIRRLLNLYHISAVPSYSLLLYLKNRNIGERELTKIIEFLTKYFIRRHICDKPKVRDLDDIFIEVIEDCENKKDNIDSNFAISKILDRSEGKLVEDEEFERALKSDIYLTNQKASKYLLVQFEESANNNLNEFRPFWDKNNKSKPYWTVEHILPQGARKLDKCWIEILDVNDEENALDKRDQLKHKIGNLTLTAYNEKLGAKCFNDKKSKLNKALIINRDILNKEVWGEQEILARTDNIVAKLVEINNLRV